MRCGVISRVAAGEKPPQLTKYRKFAWLGETGVFAKLQCRRHALRHGPALQQLVLRPHKLAVTALSWRDVAALDNLGDVAINLQPDSRRIKRRHHHGAHAAQSHQAERAAQDQSLSFEQDPEIFTKINAARLGSIRRAAAIWHLAIGRTHREGAAADRNEVASRCASLSGGTLKAITHRKLLTTDDVPLRRINAGFWPRRKELRSPYVMQPGR